MEVPEQPVPGRSEIPTSLQVNAAGVQTGPWFSTPARIPRKKLCGALHQGAGNVLCRRPKFDRAGATGLLKSGKHMALDAMWK